MADKIETILRKLSDHDLALGLLHMLDRRLGEDDPGFVADLGIALDRHIGLADRPAWHGHKIADRLLRLLAITPGRVALAHARRLISARGPREESFYRYAASLLAATRSPAELVVAFTPDAPGPPVSQELRACLAHELIVRGHTPAETPDIVAWTSAPGRRDYPLGRLPLSLSDLERDLNLPHYELDLSAYPSPGGHPVKADLATCRGASVRVSAESTTASTAATIGAAVANWVDESNGQVEARVFELARDLDAGALAATLAELGLECLEGLETPEGPAVETYPRARAFGSLFAAASSGGCYNYGLHGAYGRLAAWRSIGGLAGAAEGASPVEVDGLVSGTDWYRFDAQTEWFDLADLSFGLVAVNPRGRRLAVLAVTDSA